MEDLQAAIAGYLRAQRRRGLAFPRGAGRETAIYARVATMTQTDRAALETQIAACRAFAARDGDTEPTIYREVMGGDGLDRPRLAELRAAVAQGRIGRVLVTARERLTGDPALFASLRAEWSAQGVAIVVIEEVS